MEHNPQPAAVLFLHSNSTAKEIFSRQAEALPEPFGFIAVDLPGHGQSDDAPDPAAAYGAPGFAAYIGGLIDQLALADVVVVGNSLGGHVALELAAHPAVRGIAISGTPPIAPGPGGVGQGYRTDNPDLGLSAQEQLEPAQILTFADAVRDDGTANEPLWTAAVTRADGRVRRYFFEWLTSQDRRDHARLAIDCPVPLAIINGRNDKVIQHAHVESLPYKNLWRGAVQYIEDAGHAPFWQQPEAFNAVLGPFLATIGTGKAPAR